MGAKPETERWERLERSEGMRISSPDETEHKGEQGPEENNEFLKLKSCSSDESITSGNK